MKGTQEIYEEIKEIKSKGYIIGSNSKLLNLYKASLKPLGKEEVEVMCKELRDKFKLETWVGNNKGPVIKISGRSYERFMDLVGPFIHESMRYKLPSNRKSRRS